ncbi:MAG: NrfD/PsrC family molybdoenzyme membrane anchor subunit [Spirochaetota bacterium]
METLIHGEFWTLKELFVLPNEYIVWSIQIVMYPFMTGLVAGAFVLSSLYHVFGVKQLKDIARFALVFSFSLLFAAPIPLLLHLQQPFRALNVILTPHFTSAIAAFSVVFFTYAAIVAGELWFLYRKHLIETFQMYKGKEKKSLWDSLMAILFGALTLGALDLSEKALHKDEKAIKFLAALGIPVAAFLHGYVGFIFGSVKANALWMTPLMPVIFIVSAIVSGVALCVLTYIITLEIRKLLAARKAKRAEAHIKFPQIDSADLSVIQLSIRYLMIFLVFAISLELLDLIFRGYTAVKSWDILRSVIYKNDFVPVFILQYGIGDALPLLLFLLPGFSMRRALIGTICVLFGVFMMRWNVVIGGQAFSLTFAGFMHYQLPIIPHDIETLKEGLFGIIGVFVAPFCFFWVVNKIFPVFVKKAAVAQGS